MASKLTRLVYSVFLLILFSQLVYNQPFSNVNSFMRYPYHVAHLARTSYNKNVVQYAQQMLEKMYAAAPSSLSFNEAKKLLTHVLHEIKKRRKPTLASEYPDYWLLRQG